MLTRQWYGRSEDPPYKFHVHNSINAIAKSRSVNAVSQLHTRKSRRMPVSIRRPDRVYHLSQPYLLLLSKLSYHPMYRILVRPEDQLLHSIRTNQRLREPIQVPHNRRHRGFQGTNMYNNTRWCRILRQIIGNLIPLRLG